MSKRTIMVKQTPFDLFQQVMGLLYQMTQAGFELAAKSMLDKKRIADDGSIIRFLQHFIAGHYYHITHHLAEQLQWVTDEHELAIVLDALDRFSRKYHIQVIAWNIMSNHVHLIIRTMEASRVSKFMQAFLSSSVQRINRRRLRDALQADPHLLVEPPKVRFEGRFSALLLLEPEYLQASCVYVFTNAEKAGIPDHLGHLSRHNWLEFQKIYTQDEHLAPGDTSFAEAMNGIEEAYVARRDYWLQIRGVNPKPMILPSQRRRRLQQALDEVSRDLVSSTPGWIRKRIQYDPDKEQW